MVRSSVLASVGVAALLACGAASGRANHGEAAVEDALLASHANVPGSTDEQAQFVAGDVAKRSGSRLKLKLGNGTWRTFENDRGCDPGVGPASCVSYKLAAHLRSRRLFIVAKFRGEAVSHILIEADQGAVTEVKTAMQLSPDGRRVLLFDPLKSSDVTILRREKSRFVQEWSGHYDVPTGSVASLQFSGWPSNDVAYFRKTVWRSAGDPAFTAAWSKVLPTQSETLVALRRSGGDWRYVDQPALPKPSAAPPLRWNWRTVWLSSAA